MFPNNIIILAGGNTVREYDISKLTDYGYVIGVNDAAKYATCNHVLSMDRLWVENRLPEILKWKLPIHIKKGINPRDKFDFPVNHFKGDETSKILSDAEGTLNGSNSGSCALNLAYQLEPKKVYLLGFDMQVTKNQPYWYPQYPWRKPDRGILTKIYDDWSKTFDTAAIQFKKKNIIVKNVTHNSLIASFERISFKQFLKEANG